MNVWRADGEAIAMPHTTALRIPIPLLQSSPPKRQIVERAQRRPVHLRAGDEHTGSYMMVIRKSGPALILGLVSILTLSTAMPSLAQTQRQRPQAQEQGFAPASPPADETFGQAAPRTPSRAAGTAQQRGSCWIPTNDDFGVGYWGSCSDQKSRPVK
jgi:hypothetical protein